MSISSNVPAQLPQNGGRYTQTATSITGSASTIVWTNTVYQVGTGSMSSGIYTIVTPGLYLINCRVRIAGTFAANATVNLQILVNGSQTTLDLPRSFSAQSDVTANCSDLYQLALNDQVSIQWSSSGTGLANQNNAADTFFSIAQVA